MLTRIHSRRYKYPRNRSKKK